MKFNKSFLAVVAAGLIRGSLGQSSTWYVPLREPAQHQLIS